MGRRITLRLHALPSASEQKEKEAEDVLQSVLSSLSAYDRRLRARCLLSQLILPFPLEADQSCDKLPDIPFYKRKVLIMVCYIY